MQDGFIKAGVCSPELQVADTAYNVKKMVEKAEQMSGQGAKLVVFPELSLSGYTCGDLFLQDALLAGVLDALQLFTEETARLDTLFFTGLPMLHQGRLFNVVAAVFHGRVLGLVPKSHIPMYSEFYEGRHFAPAPEGNTRHKLPFQDEEVCFGTKQLFVCAHMPALSVAVEICEDLWVPVPPSSYHAMAGATVIVNASASDEVTGKAAYRKELVKGQSARTVAGYLYADAGRGESTTDLVYAAHNMIVENGTVLAESRPFEQEDKITELDVGKLAAERRRMTSFPVYEAPEQYGYEQHVFSFSDVVRTELSRSFEKTPFVPAAKSRREERCNEILDIQAAGLVKRLRHTGCTCAVIGLSGGLDSTLALLVTVRAFDQLGLERSGIICVTMPCFGTTDRTYENAVNLAGILGTELREIPVEQAVRQHFQDIGHDINVHDITYENGQARERTQILMDTANKEGGLVIGTGDMSELALGWATYNGDHMSMYGVNCSVPKTLVRYLVQYYADTFDEDCHDADSDALRRVLQDVLDTPVSPELLPPKDGKIAQKTEDIVGPYELHDFFLYYVLRFGFMPSKVFRMAVYAFEGVYDAGTIYKWLETFYHRFFRQQFKRSCIPDGPKVGSVALSPRGDLRMPSDASDALWKADLQKIRLP